MHPTHAAHPMKKRSPLGVWLLAIVTLGIYFTSGTTRSTARCSTASPTSRSTPPAHWRAPAFVDSHQSGTMVYEERDSSGIDTSEVHCRV
jgi:hypothetical protein